MTRATDVEIHIEELVLHGFDPAHRHLIADHVAAALGPALAEGGLDWARAPGGVAIERLDVPPITVGKPITARDAGRIGSGIAASVRRGP